MDESTPPPKGIKTLPPQHQSIPPKARPIPPHEGPYLLRTPPIPPLYGVFPPPSFYREKQSASPIVQPNRPQPIHPNIK